MSDSINQLLLAALKRAGAPQASDDLLDTAMGLGLNEGWTPEMLAKINRKSVARRLIKMADDGLVREASRQRDAGARRDTPTYEPCDAWDMRAPVPAPDRAVLGRTAGEDAPYEAMTPRERLAVFEAQDMVIESLSRFLHSLQTGLADMARTQERARQRLLAEGLEPRS